MDETQVNTIGSFAEALYLFVFEQSTVEQIREMGYDKASLTYIVASAILGGIFILLDYGIVKSGISSKSVFDLNYTTWQKTLLMVFVWSIGAGFLSWVGSTVKIFQDTIQSSAIAGFSWIYILTNLIEKYRRPEVIQEITDEIANR